MSGQGTAADDGLDLILTAHRSQGRILSIVRGQPVYLTYGCFALLTDLVKGHYQSPYGFVSGRATTYRMAVSRLRKAIDQAVVDQFGEDDSDSGVHGRTARQVASRDQQAYR